MGARTQYEGFGTPMNILSFKSQKRYRDSFRAYLVKFHKDIPSVFLMIAQEALSRIHFSYRWDSIFNEYSLKIQWNVKMIPEALSFYMAIYHGELLTHFYHHRAKRATAGYQRYKTMTQTWLPHINGKVLQFQWPQKYPMDHPQIFILSPIQGTLMLTFYSV